ESKPAEKNFPYPALRQERAAARCGRGPFDNSILPRSARGGSAHRFVVLSPAAVGGSEPAERLVIDKPPLRGILAADRALRVLADLQNSHIVVIRQRVKINHPADKRMARAEQELDRLERLDRSDKARKRAQHPGFST